MLDLAPWACACLGALLGSAIGLLAGLVPGLHTNNLSQGALASPGLLFASIGWLAAGASAGTAAGAAAGAAAGQTPPALFAACGFLFGMALGHAFTDEIPAVFLGAPDPETALSVLPGHRLLLEGLGAQAVRAAAAGSALGVCLSLPFVPLLDFLLGEPGHLYGALRPVVPVLLVGVAAALVASEAGRPANGLSRGRARALSIGLLCASGALGELVVFEAAPFPEAFPLGAPPSFAFGHMLSLFAGLFGLPTLFIAARSAAPIPADPPGGASLAMGRRRLLGAAGLGTAAGAVVGWLPGVGAAQAAVIAKLVRDRGRRGRNAHGTKGSLREGAAEFLVMQSAVATANLVFNLVALFSLLRVRSGTMAALAQAGGPQVESWSRPDAPPQLLVALLIGAAASLPLCYAGALVLGRLCAKLYRRLPPRALSAAVFVALFALIVALEGVAGLAIALAALSVGLVPPVAGVKRVHLMGAVLVPVVLRLSAAA